MTYQRRIRELRAAQHLTQAQLAVHFSVSVRTVERWETGATGVPDDIKLGLAALFGVSVPWLMGWANGDADEGHREAC